MRQGEQPGKSKAKIRRSVARTPPENDAPGRRDLEKLLAEALEQQAAASEILRVISSSPADIQPVLDAISQSAARLCEADLASVFRFDGTLIHHAAQHGRTSEEIESARRAFPQPPHRRSVTGRALLASRAVQIADVGSDPEVEDSLRIFRTVLSVPMVRDGRPVGAITVARRVTRPFTDAQTALLQTFAEQAVIALENVRLFNETKEALEQQTATSEILRTIAHAQTDVQPVFDTIVRSAAQLCHAVMASVLLTDGRTLYLPANYGSSPEALAAVRALFPRPLDTESVSGAAILTRSVVHVPDVLEPSVVEFTRQAGQVLGYRSLVTVPMSRDGRVVGAINVCRREPGRFSDAEVELLRIFADQAVIAIENVRLFNETKEALEQQTATSEILRVISRSPTDARPAFETIVASAGRLCGAESAVVYRFEAGAAHFAAHYNLGPEAVEAYGRDFPRPLPQTDYLWRIADGSVLNVADVEQDPRMSIRVRAAYRSRGARSAVWVPMVREGQALGAISVTHRDVDAFSRERVQLLKTFADQAVIAIENVRLFKELQASNRELTTALDQQTATSDILSVISQSQTDAQPVFDAIVRSAVTLCDGLFSTLFQFDGELLHIIATHNTTPEALEALHRVYPARPTPALVAGRAILERAVVHIPDIELEPESPQQAVARAVGWRSALIVPMLREGAPIGVITVGRAEPGPFADSEIELLKTFADQAVIAIENVRLFTELEGRNRDLTATSEILRVISSSPTDVQPVFDTIVRSALRLCDGLFSALFRFDGELLHAVAHHNYAPDALEQLHRTYPMRPNRGGGSGRAILDRAVVQIPDTELDLEYQQQALSRAIGWRSGLFVPMLRDGAPIGVIMVSRVKPGPFSDNEVELLKTFADQAIIAVENVRLFNELQARTNELTRSVEQLTALGEISQAVSSTLDVETVLDTIVSRASQLAGADGCAIYEYDNATEAFHIRATHNLDPVLVETLRAASLRKGEGTMGRAAEAREPIQIADIAVAGAYQSHVRDTLLGAGYRALLSVPLLLEDQVIGSLSLNRHAPGAFPPEAVEVLRTFATQSALAIQNARLFREIADKSAQLEAASRHKSEFLANMSHELRTPLNAIIGFSEILAEKMFGEINEKQTEYLQDILESGRHLLSLINDILDLSKIEAGRMELEVTEFDLPTAIENALILVRERASRHGVRLGSTIDERLGAIVGDERKVKQVLLNLLSNALKFTPEGGRVDVGARLQDGSAEVSVADTGVGIAPADQEAVFEEFRQVGTADKKAEGTGLGLALSRKFIELHGGRIWVKSQLGAGSTFTFTLPLRR